MICNRCNNLVTLDSIANEKVAGYNIESLHCPTCSSCYSLKIDGVIKTLEEILENDNKTNGWQIASDEADILAHYALSQILYRRCEGPKKERNECEFDLPDETDEVRILWKNGKAAGFYTLKQKGTFIEYRQEFYEMVTLDTAYISPEFRRCGFGVSMLEDIYKNHPNENIGFSSPIASPMLKVIEKFISYYPEMKYKLWQITDAGCEGSKKLVWFTIAKNKKNARKSHNEVRSLNFFTLDGILI